MNIEGARPTPEPHVCQAGLMDLEYSTMNVALTDGVAVVTLDHGHDRRDRQHQRISSGHPGFSQNARMETTAVLLDFYGTLARATHWVSADDVLAEHGATLSDHQRAIYFADGIDGIAHDEHSRSRDHYRSWQRDRTLAMLATTDVHPREYDTIIEKLHVGSSQRVMEPYDEVPEVLEGLRDRGIRIVICSNWDWDLGEAVEEAGLTTAIDALVSSAWVGARKPHPRIFDAALSEARVTAAEAVFVGDTWGPDVEGPLTAGIRPLYLQRDGHWPDITAPQDFRDVSVAPDLRSVLDFLG